MATTNDANVKYMEENGRWEPEDDTDLEQAVTADIMNLIDTTHTAHCPRCNTIMGRVQWVCWQCWRRARLSKEEVEG